MFDPLVAERDASQSAKHLSASATLRSDPVNTVFKKASFAE